jgi:hypothetical protein
MNLTRHAAERSQQRGVPPLVVEWLQQFGEEIFDGRGCIQRYFSKASIRAMERAFGRQPVSKMDQYLRAYTVESTGSGTIVTVGYRRTRIRRP